MAKYMDFDVVDMQLVHPYDSNVHINPGVVSIVISFMHDRRQELPVIVDERGNIVAGLIQFYVAQALGLTAIPVHRVEGLTAEQIEYFRLKDNRIGSNTWYEKHSCPMVWYPAVPIDSLAVVDRVLCAAPGPKRQSKLT